MTPKRKILIIVLALTLLAAVVFWPKKPKAAPVVSPDAGIGPDVPVTDPVVDNTGSTSTPPATTGNLKYGSTGTDVKTLQELINFNDSAYGLTATFLVVDGKFGPATQAAVKRIWKAEDVSRIQFDFAVARRKNLQPVQSRNEQVFPLRIGSYGNLVATLNVALGIYKDGAYAKNYTAKTAAAVKAKTGYVSINSAGYYNLTKQSPTIKN